MTGPDSDKGSGFFFAKLVCLPSFKIQIILMRQFFSCTLMVDHFSFIQHLLLVLFVCVSSMVTSQIFPGLTGDDLVEALQQEYTPSVLLNENEVRDTLYSRVFIEGDSVKCIYSCYARFLPEEVDPSQYLFGNGNEVGSLNLEHGWPQAKGAGDGTSGNVDMHHLYPSRVKINSDRANFPYQDIADHLTSSWYYRDIEMSMMPNNNVDAYSEFAIGQFEPREEVKGDIARAMFYFWTIYREDAIDADPQFFDIQKDYLCEWDSNDPADGFEMLRNDRISLYQGGKKNPFIIDCTLAKRSYCPEQNECTIVSVFDTENSLAQIEFDAFNKCFRVIAQEEKQWEISVINFLGQVLFSDRITSNSWSNSTGDLSGYCIVIGKSGPVFTYNRFFIL